MQALFEYIGFELKRFFKNIRLVMIFFISPLLATAVFALVTYQSPKDIDVGLYNGQKNDLSQQVENEIKSSDLLVVRDMSSADDGIKLLKTGEIKTIIKIDIVDGAGSIKILEDPRYPEVQGKVKEEVADSIESAITENVANKAESDAQAEYESLIDRNFAKFTDSILGDSASPLSTAINSELEKNKTQTIDDINTLVDQKTQSEIDSFKQSLEDSLTVSINENFGNFAAVILKKIPSGDIANSMQGDFDSYKAEMIAGIKLALSGAVEGQMEDFKSQIKSDLTSEVSEKFESFKSRLSVTNPASPIAKAIRSQVNEFKEDLKNQDASIKIDTEPVSFESSEYLPKTIRYFDRYSSGAIPLVIVLIFLLKATTSLSQDRESGVLERLFSTPASRSKIMFAKIIANILIGFISVVAIVLMLKFAFGAALGNGFIVFLVAFLTAIVSVTLGILISAIVKDLPSSIQFAFYTFFLLVLTSEFFFASENIHPYFAYVTKFSPLTYSISALRKVNLFNWGFAEDWRELVALGAFAAVYTTIASFLLNRESR